MLKDYQRKNLAELRSLMDGVYAFMLGWENTDPRLRIPYAEYLGLLAEDFRSIADAAITMREEDLLPGD